MKNKTFADRLRKTLEAQRINQAELAKKVGMSEQTISYYVKGDRLPDTDRLKAIATALNVSADYLLGIESDSVKATQDLLIKQAQNDLLDKIIAFCTELKQ